jgi:hypothetical protein
MASMARAVFKATPIRLFAASVKMKLVKAIGKYIIKEEQ